MLFIAILNIKNVVGAFSYTYDNYEYDFGDVEDAEMYSYITVWVCGTSSKDCSEIYGVISSKPVEFTYIDNSTFEFGLSGAYNGSYHSYYIPSKNVLFGGVNKSFHGSGYNVEILYTNYDLYDTDGTLIHTSDVYHFETTYLNFKYNDLTYSIYGTPMILYDYNAVFLNGHYALVVSYDNLPEYYFENYTHYLKTPANTNRNLYIFDFETNEGAHIYDDTKIGDSIAFNPEQLIYSNFTLWATDSNRSKIQCNF